VKELPGEDPPSFQTMQRLYGLASDLYGLLPWRIVNEDNLIAVRDAASGELCYCSVMGALGEVHSMNAYIGTEGLRQFHKIKSGVMADPGEFFASAHCVYVDFVQKSELQRQDRELLTWLGHPQGRGLASPVFRTMRPGFLPWFVTEPEAQMLAECITAVVAVCGAVLSQKSLKLWEDEDTFPLVTRVEGDEPRYQVGMLKSILPPEPPAALARVSEEALAAVRGKDYALRGAMELDLTYSGGAIGKKGERNACAAIALVVDAESGMVLAADANQANVPAGDMLARAFLKAIQGSRSLPKEVRVRSQKLKDSLSPLMETLGVGIRVAKRLPAIDEAQAHLLRCMQSDFGDK
jgi:hypothetical protein